MAFINEIRLLSVSLSKESGHNYFHGNIKDQQDFFKTKVIPNGLRNLKRPMETLDGDVIINMTLEEFNAYKPNFVMATNETNKVTYYFIESVRINTISSIILNLSLEPFNTYIYDVDIYPSWVTRAHKPRYHQSGMPIINTINDNVNYGDEYRISSVESYYPYKDVGFMVVCSKIDLQSYQQNQSDDILPPRLGNIPNSYHWYVFPYNINNVPTWYRVNGADVIDYSEFQKLIMKEKEFANVIVSTTIVDYLPFVNSVNDDGYTMSMDNVRIRTMKKTTGLTGSIIAVREGAFNRRDISFGNKYKGFPNYTESKLLMYPYSFTVITDFKGSIFTIKNEHVEGSDLELMINGAISSQNKTTYRVKGYKGQTLWDSSLMSDTYASIGVVGDYSTEVAQGESNSKMVARATGLAKAFGGVGFSVATGNPIGALAGVGSALSDIGGIMAKEKDIDAIPPNISQQGNNAMFDFTNNIRGLYKLTYTVTNEYADILTSWFHKFGVPVNKLEKPQLYTREHFNYLKVADCNLVGKGVPSIYLNQIKTMFEKGITLWHGDYLGNYSLNNGEI